MRGNPRGSATPGVLRELLAVASDAAEELGSPLAGFLRTLAGQPDLEGLAQAAHEVETKEFEAAVEQLVKEALEAAGGGYEEADLNAVVEPYLERNDPEGLLHIVAQSPAVKADRYEPEDFRVQYPWMSRPISFQAVLRALAMTTLYNAVQFAAIAEAAEAEVEAEAEAEQEPLRHRLWAARDWPQV